ncbi:hypothetical protein AVEN_177165-1 [Araneus ventricosus]|uniref:Uncharacterized protein n=1 Tax=Araneus ventricosus TaxID=182803 RepID=A0A4Y2QQH9_ARAVE|nr:hypothetical protein AVEN_177165-1 [Araneus ventricosus]
MSKCVFLNLEQRIEVLRQYENGKLDRKLAEIFNCGRTQINKDITEKDMILKEYEDFEFRGVKSLVGWLCWVFWRKSHKVVHTAPEKM